MRKAERSVSKQGHLQPRSHGQVTKQTTVTSPILYTVKAVIMQPTQTFEKVIITTAGHLQE